MGVPLCCHYVVMQFRSFDVQVMEATGPVDLRVDHGIGTLADGDSELMGTWISPGPVATDWLDLLTEVRERGVERVRFMVGPAAFKVRAAEVWGACEAPDAPSQRVQRLLRLSDARSIAVSSHLQWAARRLDGMQTLQSARTLIRAAQASTERWLCQPMRSWAPAQREGSRLSASR